MGGTAPDPGAYRFLLVFLVSLRHVTRRAVIYQHCLLVRLPVVFNRLLFLGTRHRTGPALRLVARKTQSHVITTILFAPSQDSRSSLIAFVFLADAKLAILAILSSDEALGAQTHLVLLAEALKQGASVGIVLRVLLSVRLRHVLQPG